MGRRIGKGGACEGRELIQQMLAPRIFVKDYIFAWKSSPTGGLGGDQEVTRASEPLAEQAIAPERLFGGD